MEIQNLSPNKENPRIITDEKLAALKKALNEFGDLGGFVYNIKTKRLVTGHQRRKAFGKAAIKIDRKHAKPTRTGTVAEGHVMLSGERFSYREVRWDEQTEKAAAIAANEGAGDWDMPRLSSWMADLEATGFDLDLTLFDKDEIEAMKPKITKAKKAKDAPEPKSKGEKKRVHCPECGHKFVPGWS